ncbi:MAG: hypothetical protein QW512_00355 [Thermofilaceae archaeon]
MPIRRTSEEIEKVWSVKITNPDVARFRTEDVATITKDRIKKVVRFSFPINEFVRVILDRHGISGTKRVDYYNYGRKIWWLIYDKGDKISEKLIEFNKEYFRSIYGLEDDIMNEILESLKPHALTARAEEIARRNAERKAFLAKLASTFQGEVVGGPEAGDSGSSQDSGATAKSRGQDRDQEGGPSDEGADKSYRGVWG